jgi:hypothetical protein
VTPHAEGEIDGNPPQDFLYTIKVENADKVKWAVFQVSLEGRWTSASNFTTVDVPGGSGQFQVTGKLLGDRDRLVVKTMDDAVQDVTEGVRFKRPPAPPPQPQPPPQPGSAYERARKWLAPLRYGINVERSKLIWDGWITDDTLRSYAAAGVTHVRYFPASGGRYPLLGQDQIRLWLDVCRRTIACGMKAHLDLLDVMGIEHMNDGVARYIEECGRTIAAAGIDPDHLLIGSTNEWAGGDNKTYEVWRERLAGILHAALPNHVIAVNGGWWGSPDRMIDGTMKVDASKPRIHQWHLYDHDAGSPGNPVWWQGRIEKWAADNKAVTYCGEWGVGPPDNSNGAATRYEGFPSHILNAAKGMGQQRPCHWTVTDGGWWRLNEGNSARLRPEVAAAIKEGSAHMAAQDWFRTDNAG